MIKKIFNKYQKYIRWIYVNRAIIISFFILMILGAYLGYLIFGNNSLEVLLSIKDKKDSLEQSVKNLKDSNAKLQKQLFELKGLEP